MKKGCIIPSLIGMFSLVTTISLAAEIKVGGGGAACSGFFAPAAESFMAKTGIVLNVIETNPVHGLIQLDEGNIDVATSAVPLDFMVKSAARNGVPIDPARFTVTEIGVNKTLVFTHKSNKVKALSKKQLKEIFTGKVTNWHEVGGASQEIAVVWGIGTPGQNDLFTNQILDGESLTKRRIEVTNYKSITTLIQKIPGAIGIDPQGFAGPSTNNPKTPLITSKVIVVTKGHPSAGVKKLIQFVKDYRKK